MTIFSSDKKNEKWLVVLEYLKDLSQTETRNIIELYLKLRILKSGPGPISCLPDTNNALHILSKECVLGVFRLN